MLERYGENAAAQAVCPGEAGCLRFQSAKGGDRLEKERNACRPCELFPTKTERYRESQKGLQELVEHARYAIRRRDSGYPMPMHQITNLMLETMMMIDECRETQERKLRLEMRQALIVGLGLEKKI